MPEWLIERGIGEARSALVDNGEIIEARIELEGAIRAGTILKARLKKAGMNGRKAVAVAEGGTEYLLPLGAPGVTEGASLTIEVTREVIPGPEPWKLAIARVSDETPADADPVRSSRELSLPAPRDLLGEAGWNELIEEARSGIVSFAGGELRVSVTPAMTLIDVDGYLGARDLAVAGASEAARAIRRLDIGGSIGIDLPTVSGKTARMEAAEAIDRILPQPFERTAVNGFGFAQIIRPRRRPSLLELASDRAMFEARALLRRASLESPGPKSLAAHPAVIVAIERREAWLEALSRQLGGPVRLRADPSLPMSGGYAEPA